MKSTPSMPTSTQMALMEKMLGEQDIEIERLRNLNSALSHKANEYVIDNARMAEEIERLRAAFEVESALREHWGKQWEEQYAENERLRAEVSELQTEMDGEIQAAKMHIDAYLEANERLRAELNAAAEYIGVLEHCADGYFRVGESAEAKAYYKLMKPEEPK